MTIALERVCACSSCSKSLSSMYSSSSISQVYCSLPVCTGIRYAMLRADVASVVNRDSTGIEVNRIRGAGSIKEVTVPVL